MVVRKDIDNSSAGLTVTVTRETLIEQVWGYTAAEYAQNVSTHINRLRKKLEPDLENPVYVKTVRGFGYAFAELDDFAQTDA